MNEIDRSSVTMKQTYPTIRKCLPRKVILCVFALCSAVAIWASTTFEYIFDSPTVSATFTLGNDGKWSVMCSGMGTGYNGTNMTLVAARAILGQIKDIYGNPTGGSRPAENPLEQAS